MAARTNPAYQATDKATRTEFIIVRRDADRTWSVRRKAESGWDLLGSGYKTRTEAAETHGLQVARAPM